MTHMEQKKLSRKALEIASRSFRVMSSERSKLQFIVALILECPESLEEFIELNEDEYYKIIPMA